ncbi:MAG: hypothetical protein HYU36_10310 [Planctomycetes bacterium]|nr:hypothetical protein [Planctomycetota bacterium]
MNGKDLFNSSLSSPTRGFHRGGGRMTLLLEGAPGVAPAASAPASNSDLLPILRRIGHYLVHMPEPEYDYECSHCIGPLGYPAVVPVVAPSRPRSRDAITIGQTDAEWCRSYDVVREMLGVVPDAPEVEAGIRRRLLSLLRDDGWVWIPEKLSRRWTGAATGQTPGPRRCSWGFWRGAAGRRAARGTGCWPGGVSRPCAARRRGTRAGPTTRTG